MNKNWFEVDRKGLRALQAGKSKTFVIRELVQNAFDEAITECRVTVKWVGRHLTVIVEDDSPEGFLDLRHAYTLYADTYKRRDAEKRGRFNMGEKEVISICEYAEIITTKGAVSFSIEGRRNRQVTRFRGSHVRLEMHAKKEELLELTDYAKTILPPKGIKYYVDEEIIPYQEPFKTCEEILATEILDENGAFRSTQRKTRIDIHKSDDPHLFEMGIPVCKIDCGYSINVQQKIPLSTDRTKVSQSYLKHLYAFILNQTYECLTEDTSSDTWVRTASTSPKVSGAAITEVVKKRFGDKVVVANPNDRVSIDRAVSEGYRVIRGAEMNAEEWANVKKNDIIESSSSKFGSLPATDCKTVKPTSIQEAIGEFAWKLANIFFAVSIKISWVHSKQSNYLAEYGHKTLVFNLAKIPDHWWTLTKGMIDRAILDLLIHELCHEKGYHYEKSYHEALTFMGSKLVIMMRDKPEFFNIK